MRENKQAIIWTSVLSALALMFSIFLHYTGKEYSSNILAGIFASGILALLIAVINYRVARRKTLEKFYSYASKAASNYNQFENEGDLERSIDSVLEMNRFDYLELDNAYGDMDFIFNKKKTLHYIYVNIYEPTLRARKVISEVCWHLKEYRKTATGNKQIMRNKIQIISELIMSRTEQKTSTEPGVAMVVTATYNKLSHDMRAELNGHFFEIMYPFRKEAESNAD